MGKNIETEPQAVRAGRGGGDLAWLEAAIGLAATESRLHGRSTDMVARAFSGQCDTFAAQLFSALEAEGISARHALSLGVLARVTREDVDGEAVVVDENKFSHAFVVVDQLTFDAQGAGAADAFVDSWGDEPGQVSEFDEIYFDTPGELEGYLQCAPEGYGRIRSIEADPACAESWQALLSRHIREELARRSCDRPGGR